MLHDARGHWLREAVPHSHRPPPAPLEGDADADVVVVGGGFTGLWTAWHLLDAEPALRVVLLEADRCAHGPSGRNGGFVTSLWESLEHLTERHGTAAAAEVARASGASVEAIGRWCAEQGADAHWVPCGHLEVSTAPDQDGAARALAACAAAAAPDEVAVLDGAQTRSRCDSPVLREGVLWRTAGTVQPALLALALRDRLVARGARVHERSPVVAVHESGPRAPVEVRTAGGGRVRAGAAVLGLGAATASERGPLRRRFVVASSHLVVTAPAPAVLDALGWRDGVAISDRRALLHYTRPTRDGRIAFGWAGGRMACGARLHGRIEVDPEVVAETAGRLRRWFPQAAGVPVTHAWGGPIDVSLDHLPQVGTLAGGRVHWAAGYTGNGVGPSHLCARILASLALDRRDAASRLALVDPPAARVPPEPLKWLGGSALRRVLLAADRAQDDPGARGGRVLRAAATLPRRLGVHVSR